MLCSWVKVNTSNLFVKRIHFNTAKGEISERIMREISTITFCGVLSTITFLQRNLMADMSFVCRRAGSSDPVVQRQV